MILHNAKMKTKMKTIICTKYGDAEVLQMRESERPRITADGYLVKVHATSATTADWRIRSLKLPLGFGFLGRLIFGLFKPRNPILGTELAGTIVERGEHSTSFAIGDTVIVQCGASMGAYAEYRLVSDKECIVRKPEFLSFEEAAVLSFGASTAWGYLIEKAKIKPGQSVLIYGASGSVGSAAVQIAKSVGATVTAVCSGANQELMHNIGADHVIDYQKEDFLKNGSRYDVILDTVGTLNFLACRKSLRRNGQLLLVSANLFQMMLAMLVTSLTEKRIVIGVVNENRVRLQSIIDLVRQKRYRVLIDQTFHLDSIAEAHRHIEKRHRKGNVAIRVM